MGCNDSITASSQVAPSLSRVRLLGAIAAVLIFAPGTALAVVPPSQYHAAGTRIRLITYTAHDGLRRRAWLVLPADYDDTPIPLVISPHGRGVDALDNA